MTELTKEQLIEEAKLKIAIAKCHPNSGMARVEGELFKIALASLEAEPLVPVMYKGMKLLTKEGLELIRDGIAEATGLEAMCMADALLSGAPAPVVPDERAAFNSWNNDENLPIAGVGAKNAAWLAWQARAELGHSLVVNSPVTPDGWISCSERMPEETDDHDLLVVSGGLVLVGICYARRGGFYISALEHDDDNPYGGQIGCVTHWMPLPEPPQEVNRG
ncbi:TPA: DUF551 domain-containing protein [Escherichia coli]|nr:DUF551 domain-containing protein [Escherichia coli]